ncbi:hypothetical protein C7N43_10590 [Sphingobacteriales bacterium UPWRP_1]|nr:hypothetical protein BVG80_13930 [Sphingobacteriales bacterium TSM_CSM]PSJ77080.1 hypothetical protein C7N43_10590 [Sphingobacteriales bacterium UPWRP_1]
MNYFKEKYINPLTDFGFKKLFGSEPNKELLIDFLNQVLPEKHRVKNLTYAKSEHLGDKQLDRKAIFDLYCIGQSGEHFIVELQKAKQNFFKDRSVYYASFPIQTQAKRGNWDYKLEPVYTIGILDFEFDDHKGTPDILHTVELKNQHCETFYDKLVFIYIELPKFNKTEAELTTHFDKWLYLFKYLSVLQDRPKAFQDKIFERLFKAAEIARFSPEEREAYRESLKYYRDLQNVVDTSREEGLKEGREEGLKEGREEGLKEGREMGTAELKLQIARQMKAMGEPADKIARYTGLPANEIDKL